MTLVPASSRGVGGVVVTDSPSAGEVLTADSATTASWQAAGGAAQLAYAEIVAAVTISSTDANAPNEVVSSGAVVYDGTRVCIEFYSPRVDVGGVAGSFTILSLWDDATDLGRLCLLSLVLLQTPVYARRFLTPSAASHTYKVQGYRVNSNGAVQAGAGGDDVTMPAFIRVSEAPS